MKCVTDIYNGNSKTKKNCVSLSNKLTQKIVTPKSSHNSLYESLTNLRGHLKKTKPLLLELNHLAINGNKETLRKTNTCTLTVTKR